MPFEKKEKITICCAWCGKFVKSRPWRKGKIKYCSLKCKYCALRKSMLIKHAAKKKIKYRMVCKNFYCNKPFIVILSLVKKRKYCSRKCYEISKTNEYKKELLRRNEIKIQQNYIKNILSLNKRNNDI